MKVILSIAIVGEAGGRALARKEYDLPFPPVEGMDINDHAWKDARTAKKVTLDPSEPSALVQFDNDRQTTKELFEQQCEIYRLHKWNVA